MTPPLPTVFINARFLTQEVTGVQRYALELVRALDELIDEGSVDARYAFVLLAPRDSRSLELKHIPVRRVGRLAGHPWEQLELPRYTRGHLLLSLCNTSPVTKRNQVVTIHDAAVFAVPEGFSRPFRLLYRALLPALVRVSRKIITVSDFSKAELVKHCGARPEGVVVVYEGKEQIFRSRPDTSVLAEHGLETGRYVFAVSSLDPRKNFAVLATAATHLAGADFTVVTAGGVNPKVFGTVDERSNGSMKHPDMKHLGYVTDEALRALYENAGCFVYPSRYEGFGLPPLEAMACGCPVIASHAPPLPEVCGNAALYCDPDDPRDLAKKIQRLMNDEPLRESLRAKGLERAAAFSWRKCAEETLAVLDEVVP